jgi:WD40 repeat protein
LERRYAEIWDVDRRSRITTLQLDAIDQDAGDEGDVLGDVLGWAVAFRPDGRTLATADIDPLVHLWDVRTDYPIRVLDQNVRGLVLTLEFSPDGTILAVAGGNSPASLWDVATGAQTGPWSGFTVSSHGSTIDLSSDGRRLLMTQGGKGAVWDIDPESWARRACALANRTLTRTEWEEFLPGRPYEPACST